MKTIKVGGVPEHFNLPWHQCIEQNKFENEGIKVTWKDFPEGTGAMCKALRAGEIDVAVILTEGIIRDIINGNPAKIIQTYIASPLIWGIHVDARSPYKNVEDLEGTKAAISREGSGSHLMAYVNAEHKNWDIDNLQFEIINNLEGAIEALKNDEAQYFMWEHFTTKPLVDNHTFRLVADCPTPWPCFVIAATDDSIKNDSEALKKMLKVLNEETKDFKDQENIDISLSERYQQKLEDIRKWLDLTQWSQQQISKEDLEKVQKNLLRLNLIEREVSHNKLIHKL
ncbi:ABC-type nitrate/sulfonate/bicarbonate transport system substrate-binding protein [Christiangramia gaetbulicola]|uniref:ABC-type nitrate/sulfonate/bicarbonate transport system substrate-binding protein n=1 Tax=Christiangramia gaetbulicola TaxID=703340 RepID=A0A2T6AGZ8_9FLAO|nr:substrate-binding domain-containing protein [Christiangramia gaetbulicola]PTX43071.1 ABC-type nitrate/sulfonate/bicarbonate transport system substrate-binding protein [Christiangramia gaetbulicola]